MSNISLGDVKIIDIGNKFGSMNTKAKFFPEGLSAEERKAIFLNRRMAVGREYGFDGHKVFMADQDDKRGTYFEISEEYVKENPNGWTDIPQDILLVTDKVPGVVIGYPTADCPVVMMTDPVKGASAIAHCGASLIDMKMPMLVADALLKAYGSRDSDILTYVSACAGTSWSYDRWPKWATDSRLWEDCIVADENGIFHIDMRKAIMKQLVERNIDLDCTTFNMDDTITNPDYYSNAASSPYGGNDPSKAGRNFAGLYYPKRLVKTRNN